ncbi:proton-coupled amino acid transporter-like protein pathetic isoform X1 [Galleria mellonella]|uniref:Proton-coupled amino acid transporter-like protein pathetic isoform X1 n=1 Tax=Galleria mellonella TaxID=7137 RepID=A0A6J1X9N0_GALME|nr:proton-coupled amino acid transporter-like protein pathetic isoform X1 [Galleria mellonella]
MSTNSIYESDQKEYNPFEHRIIAKPNSDIRSLANLVKASLGSGLLAVPLAFSNSGWGIGIIGTAIIALICTHCAHIFVEVSQECCRIEKTPLLGYADTCRAAFLAGPKASRRYARFSGIFAECSIFCTYIGVACIFTVLIADSIKQLFDTYYPVFIVSIEYYCLILLIPLCLLVQIRHLKFLAPISFIANVLLVATFAICLYYIFKDGLTFSDRKFVGEASRFPAFLSTIIFAMEGIGVVMPVANAMKNPQRFLGCPGVLSIAMLLVALLYGTLGLFGYFKYGDVLRGSITLNLPMDDWPAICAKCFIALSIFFTYPLHFFCVIDVITRHTESHIKENYRSTAQVFIRIAIVLFCGGIGVALPMLEQIINLVGSLFYSILGVIIPGIIETILRWDNLGKYNWILWKNILIVLFGFCCMISGCAVTIIDIISIVNRKTE